MASVDIFIYYKMMASGGQMTDKSLFPALLYIFLFSFALAKVGERTFGTTRTLRFAVFSAEHDYSVAKIALLFGWNET